MEWRYYLGVAMPDTGIFTDRHLKLFYANLLNHYNACRNRLDNNPTAIYNELFAAVQFALRAREGDLYHLRDEEKDKVNAYFEIIFRALPIYRDIPLSQRNSFNPPRPPYNPQVRYIYNQYNNYKFSDSLLLNWLFISSLTHSYQPFPSNIHRHGDRKSNQSIKENALIILILIALAACAAVLTLISLYYMLNEFLNSVERFHYNEGWLRAALMLANAAVFSVSSFLLANTFIAPALFSLALIVGLNPVAVAVTGVILLSVIGAGIGAFFMGMLHDSIEKKLNKNTMDPNDPLRFRLTETDEKALIEKGIDPLKVKCALVALRAEIAKTLNNEQAAVPSFLNRHIGNGKKIQPLLQQVRHLRQGKIDYIRVGTLVFNCKQSQRALPLQQPTPSHYPFTAPPLPPQVQSSSDVQMGIPVYF